MGFGDMMNGLQNKITSIANVEFQQIIPLSSDIYNELDNADVFLLGPLTIDPLKQVQRAHQQNKVVSIVVLIFPEQFQRTKQQIQFGFNVGKNFTLLPYDFGKDISEVVDSGIKRSQQRKSFLKISNQATFPSPVSREITFQNLALFLENAPMGAIVFDVEKKVVSANYRAKQYFEKVDFRYPVNWNSLFPGEEYPAEVRGREPAHEIIKVNNQYLEINISPLQIEKGSPHYLLLINDITRTVNIENQLRNKIDELEFLNKELDEFVNVVSHDFKTPLTSIGLLAQLALREKSQEKQINFLNQILNSSKKLKEQLNGLSKLVDIKKNRSDKVEEVNFQERLDLALAEYGNLKDLDAQVISDFSKAPLMNYFKAHIDSLFNNLITNAIKYRQKDQTLTIEVAARNEKDYVVLTVKDNGIGIDLAKNMNKLFQPFKRLTDQSTGSGLGLSMIKRIIEQNNGYLEVFSEVGGGTEFTVYLRNQR